MPPFGIWEFHRSGRNIIIMPRRSLSRSISACGTGIYAILCSGSSSTFAYSGIFWLTICQQCLAWLRFLGVRPFSRHPDPDAATIGKFIVVCLIFRLVSSRVLLVVYSLIMFSVKNRSKRPRALTHSEGSLSSDARLELPAFQDRVRTCIQCALLLVF